MKIRSDKKAGRQDIQQDLQDFLISGEHYLLIVTLQWQCREVLLHVYHPSSAISRTFCHLVQQIGLNVYGPGFNRKVFKRIRQLFTIRQCVNLTVDKITNGNMENEKEQRRKYKKYASSFKRFVVETALQHRDWKALVNTETRKVPRTTAKGWTHFFPPQNFLLLLLALRPILSLQAKWL